MAYFLRSLNLFAIRYFQYSFDYSFRLFYHDFISYTFVLIVFLFLFSQVLQQASIGSKYTISCVASPLSAALSPPAISALKIQLPLMQANFIENLHTSNPPVHIFTCLAKVHDTGNMSFPLQIAILLLLRLFIYKCIHPFPSWIRPQQRVCRNIKRRSVYLLLPLSH